MFSRLSRTTSRFMRASPSSFTARTPFPIFTFQRRNYAEKSEEDEESNLQTIGVILTGPGYLDSSEVTEAVSSLIHLTGKEEVSFLVFAPDADQDVTIDHLTKNVEKNEIRNMRSESVRITRGKVHSINLLSAHRCDSLLVVGGGGVTRSLSTYAEDGQSEFQLLPKMKSLLQDFHKNGFPMAFIGQAPLLPAHALGKKSGGPGIKVTVGNDNDLKEACVQLGNKVVTCDTHEYIYDKENKIFSTPGFLSKTANAAVVHKGIGNMLEEFFKVITGEVEEGNQSLFGEEIEIIGEGIHGPEKWAELKKEMIAEVNRKKANRRKK